MGNIFYSQGMNMICNKFKSIALETLKKITNLKDPRLPKEIQPQTPEENLFEIFSYFYIIQIE